jgi:hypothetical protein
MSFLLRDRSVRIGLVSPETSSKTTGDPTEDPMVKGFMGNLTRAVELQTVTSMFDLDSKKLLKLTGVKEVRLNFSSDIAIENGLAVSFIQAWYIKPAEITITGNAYIGAYPVVQRRDADVEVLYNMYLESLNEFGSRTMPGNKKIFQLQIVNNPRNADFYYGYIKNFEFGENVENPYLLEYTI